MQRDCSWRNKIKVFYAGGFWMRHWIKTEFCFAPDKDHNPFFFIAMEQLEKKVLLHCQLPLSLGDSNKYTIQTNK